MRNVLVLSTAVSVLTIGLGSINAAVAEPESLQEFVHKVQSGGEKAPGAKGQEGGGKGTAPGAREGGVASPPPTRHGVVASRHRFQPPVRSASSG